LFGLAMIGGVAGSYYTMNIIDAPYVGSPYVGQ
jgi:hypothetical protein